MAGRIVGLDISADRLLAAEVSGSSSRSVRVHRVCAVELPPGAARDAEVIDVPAVSAALRQLWREAGFRSKHVVLGVGNQRVLVREHTVPALPEGELQQSLPYQVADSLPLPADETILDFYPIAAVEGSSPLLLQGLLVAAVREVIETNIAAITGASLRVVGVDLSPFAMLRTLTLDGTLGGCRTIVFLGGRTSYLVVAVDGIPRFVRIVPAGRDTVVESVCETLGVETAAAEAMLDRQGLASGGDETVEHAVRIAFQPLISSIQSTHTYYLSNFSGQPIDGVVVLGSGAQVPGLASAVAGALQVPVSSGVSLDGVDLTSTVDDAMLDRYRADLAIPVGLAIDAGRHS